jgi:hypothetical protein
MKNSLLRNVAAVAAGRITSGAIRGAAEGARKRMRRVIGGTSQSQSQSVLSTQHDVSTRFKARKASSGKIKRKRKFAARVRNAIGDEEAAIGYTIKAVANVSCAANTAGAFSVGTYNVGGESAEVAAMYVDTYGAATAPYTKLLMKSAVLDVEVANTGANGVILDVYELVCRRSYTTAVTADSQWTTQFGQQQTTSSKAATDPANSIFQAPNFLKYWKVINKKEVNLGAGSCTTLQVRDAKNRYIQGVRLTSEPQYLKGVSRVLYFSYHGHPINNLGTAQLGAGALTWAYQKSYLYGIPPGQTKENMHNA